MRSLLHFQKEKVQELSHIPLSLVLHTQLFLHTTAKGIFLKKKKKSEKVTPSLKFSDAFCLALKTRRTKSDFCPSPDHPYLIQATLGSALSILASPVFLSFFCPSQGLPDVPIPPPDLGHYCPSA